MCGFTDLRLEKIFHKFMPSTCKSKDKKEGVPVPRKLKPTLIPAALSG